MSDAKQEGNGEQPHGFREWLFEGQPQEPEGFFESEAEVKKAHHTHPWWQVMCLTGVDYFSTLGYQPGIAALAAGALSPIATLVLVLVTLFGALPMYRRVAEESPHGDGSISMLERLLSYWPSKFLVLALIGFVATGFVITITLSAADAAAHVIENPFVHDYVQGREVIITLSLIALLGAVFLKGFNEAIGIAVVIVIAYISLSLVVVGVGVTHLLNEPQKFTDWTNLLFTSYASPLAVIGAALLVFPKLALGLSGFETGVVVMPLVKGDKGDTEEQPKGRIKNAKKLLLGAAAIMSVMLISSAFVTTTLVPHHEFWPATKTTATVNVDTWRSGTATVNLPLEAQEGAKETLDVTIPNTLPTNGETLTLPANYKNDPFEVQLSGKLEGNNLEVTVQKRQGEAYGRALAYLAHEFLGDAFGTVYDIATILILWFAGASAMAGLLNIVPRYLPKYGMAPDWTRATRPLVLIFTLICFVVTIAFNASVTAQSSAYATGVLALMTSAAVAVTLSTIRRKQTLMSVAFAIISAIFIYTTAVTIIEQPNGLQIASLFIAAIIVISLFSRVYRSLELRVTRIELDRTAQEFIDELAHHEIRIIANKRQRGDEGEYQEKELRQRESHHIEAHEPVAFFEVEISDASDFSNVLKVEGMVLEGVSGRYRIMRAKAPAVPNAIAAFLMYTRDRTKLMPHCYFTWSDGNPITHLMRYIVFGEGDTAPVTHEILRQVEPEPRKRPVIHVGG